MSFVSIQCRPKQFCFYAQPHWSNGKKLSKIVLENEAQEQGWLCPFTDLSYSFSSNHRWFCCFSQRALHGVYSPCSYRSEVRWGRHIRWPCVYCLSSRSGIVFNPSADASTDHSQSAKDIDPCFKSQFYVEDPDHRRPVLILPNGLSKPGERAHDRN